MRPSRVRPVLVVASTFTLFVFAFPAVLADLGPGSTFYYRQLIFPADIALAVTVVAAVVVGVTTRTRPTATVALLGLLAASLAVAFVFHPSPQGVFTVARVAGATALAYAVSGLTRTERLLAAGTLAVTGLVQLGIALAQLAHGGPLGLPALGETADAFLDYGPLAPRGTMHGQAVLAGLGLVIGLVLVREAFERRAALGWCVIAGLVVVPVGLTFSRAAALAMALAVIALALAIRTRRRVATMAIACLIAGAGGAAVVDHEGWESKVGGVGISGNGRETVTVGALDLIASAPLTGVGPGRSVDALRERNPVPPPVVGYEPAHNFVLVTTVEGGILSGTIAAALLLVLGWRARRDLDALALFVAFLPAVLTDQYPYTFLQGLVLLAVWIGMIDRSGARPDTAT